MYYGGNIFSLFLSYGRKEEKEKERKRVIKKEIYKERKTREREERKEGKEVYMECARARARNNNRRVRVRMCARNYIRVHACALYNACVQRV